MTKKQERGGSKKKCDCGGIWKCENMNNAKGPCPADSSSLKRQKDKVSV